jgi:hypothetical protein
MKSPLPLRLEDHPSYQLHRKQRWTQILLPLLIAVLMFIAVIVLTSIAAFRDNGDVSRWAAISEIWLVLPVMAAGLVLLAILIGLIYLLMYITPAIPPYTYQAQRFVYRIEGFVKRFAEFAHRPALILQELSTLIKKYLAQIRKG